MRRYIEDRRLQSVGPMRGFENIKLPVPCADIPYITSHYLSLA